MPASLNTKAFGRLLAVVLILIALGIALSTARFIYRPAQSSSVVDQDSSLAFKPGLVGVKEGDWKTFAISGGLTGTSGAHASQILRYVGPFFRLEGEGTNEVEIRSAVVEMIAGGRQDFVQVGDFFDVYQIMRIDAESITVRQGGTDYELHLSFTNAMTESGSEGETMPASEDDQPALEVSRFGKRIGEYRWVIQRQAILDYYQELSDDPERLVAVFDSLEPDYGEEGNIQGYQLVAKGEADFFKAVGLQENDYVRKVNSMNMSSRKRAEYFIGEFLKDRLGGVVIDIEREGKPEKLIYFVR